MFEQQTATPAPQPKGNRRQLLWLLGAMVVAVLIVGILVVGLFATPYCALWGMKRAAESRDAQAFCSFIDFPVLRENLKAELNAKALFDMQRDEKLKNNPFAGFATAAAPTIINNIVEGYVTPAAIERGFKQESLTQQDKNLASETLNKDFLDQEKGQVETAYKSFNEFQVAFVRKEGEPILLIFERRNIINWQLVSIKFR
ncbi:MAG: DUF2939 domain-containing protein [Pyrinomonadaceae bacterium]